MKTLCNSVSALCFSVLALLLFSLDVLAQREERKLIDNGNAEYKAGKYNEAEILYRKSLEKNRESEIANFNLADALYKQGKFEDAANIFQGIAGKTTDKDLKSKAYHNLGNSLLKTEKYQESVNAYKNALKTNSVDDETRYNLAYAMSKLQQQQQQQQNQQNQDKKDDKQDKQEQQKPDEKKDDQKQDKQEQADNKEQQEKEEQQQQQQKQDKLSKQDADRMLDALGKEEKDVQDKMKKERLKTAQKVKIEKDW